MATAVEQIKKKLLRLESKLKKYDLNNPQEVYNYYGGWSVGYIQGKIAALEDILDVLDNENVVICRRML